MRMKIKGVYKQQVGAKRKGDPVEYNPLEKVPLAVKSAMIDGQTKGRLNIVSKVDCVHPAVFPLATKSPKGFASNRYKASGKVTWQEHNMENDKLYPPKSGSFEIEFEDSQDSLGQPDLKINTFSLT